MTRIKSLCLLMRMKGLRKQNALPGARDYQDICPAGLGGLEQRDYPLLLNFAALDTTNRTHLSEDRPSLYHLLSAQTDQASNMTSYLYMVYLITVEE